MIQRECRKVIKGKNSCLHIHILYFRDTFPLNNLISHFHSPGKFLLILWGWMWRLPPPKELSLNFLQPVCDFPCLASYLSCAFLSCLLMCSPCVSVLYPYVLLLYHTSYVPMFSLCVMLWALQRTRISLAHHHISLHQNSSWHNKCLLNEGMNDKN